MANEGVGRAGDAVLRAAGGRMVALRVAVPSAGAAEELGLAAPQFQEIEVGPAVLVKDVLLVSATSLEALVGVQGAASVRALLLGADGLVVNGAAYAVTSVDELGMGCAAMGYRLTLRAVGDGE